MVGFRHGDDDEHENQRKPYPQMKKKQSAPEKTGVLFSMVDGRMSDEHLHDEMLEAVAPVANEAGIRVMMKVCGITREEACRLSYPDWGSGE